MLRPGKFASPAPARTSTSKLSSPKVTSKRRRIYYAGIQSIPATGLAPARHAALWAASEEHERAKGTANRLTSTIPYVVSGLIDSIARRSDIQSSAVTLELGYVSPVQFEEVSNLTQTHYTISASACPLEQHIQKPPRLWSYFDS